LDGQNGGSGFTGPWTFDYATGASLTVAVGGFSVSGLIGVGNKVQWSSGGTSGIGQCKRSLALINTDIVYFRAIINFGPGASLAPAVKFVSAGVTRGAVGAANGFNVVSILDSSLTTVAASSYSSTVQRVVLVQINYFANTTKLWVDPDLDTFEYSSPPPADASASNFAPPFDTLDFFSRSPFSMDEISVLRTACTGLSSRVCPLSFASRSFVILFLLSFF
jgi:hypothetical protein